MTQKVCNYEKFGYCRMKETCSDYHPIDVCSEKLCRISRCRKRHPKPCIFFQSGSCKYDDFCKYSHEDETKDLKAKVIKLEEMNKLLHERVSNIEKEYMNFLKKYSEDCTSVIDPPSDEVEMNDVTSVCDDQNMKLTKRKRNNEELKVEDKKTKIDNDDLPTREEYESVKNQLSQRYKNSIDGFQKDKVFCESLQHSIKEIVNKIDGRTIDATIKVIEDVKIKTNNSYKSLINHDGKGDDVEIFMNNFNLSIESIKAKRINKKSFKKYSTTNLQSIIEELIQIINSKNVKLTEIIQKAIKVKKMEYPKN